MNPETVIFVIRSTIRLAGAANDALEQQIRDRGFRMPDVDIIWQSFDDSVMNFFRQDSYRHYISEDGPLGDYWDARTDNYNDKPDSKEKITQAYFEIVGSTRNWRNGAGGGRVALQPHILREASFKKLSQWAEADQPASPWTRIGYIIADVALEYLSSNPSLVKEGGQGEKLIIGFVNNLREMLPDIDHPDFAKNHARYGFAERITGIFVRAGLKTLGENVSILIEEEHFQELAKNTLNPIVEAFVPEPGVPHPVLWTSPNLNLLKDTLLGPVTSAAIQTLADNQQSVLGNSFNPEKAIGAVTQALLVEAADPDFRNHLGSGGILRLHKTVLNVAVKRPELFINGGNPNRELAQVLFKNIAGTLSTMDSLLHDGLGEDILAITFETLAEHGPALIKTDDGNPWEAFVTKSAESVLNGLAKGFSNPESKDRFRFLFSREQATKLGRIFLNQAAKTPGMLTGAGANEELKNIVAGVTTAMAKDDALLLTADDWTEIAGLIMEMAAQNPERLFKINQDNPEAQLGTKIIQSILKTASADFRVRGRANGALLFGKTLNDAIQSALHIALGNIEKAENHLPEIEQLIIKINETANTFKQRIGADEWLWLFRKLLVEVIDDEVVPQWTSDEILEFLNQR